LTQDEQAMKNPNIDEHSKKIIEEKLKEKRNKPTH
jgi:hypothetical protein